MSSTPNGHVIRFEIPGFGVAKFRPESFTRILAETANLTAKEIVYSLMNDGWVLSATARPINELTLLEWKAIWGECHGYGEA